MRKIKHLSPSSISKFEEDIEEFYMQYLCEAPPPRMPQLQVMSIGSAFDAYAKSYLHEALFGKNHDPKFELMTLFEAQVEPQNRDWAYEHGKWAFEQYKKTGALADLMLDLQQSIGTPKFELEVKGVINGHREGVTLNIENVILLGKPDVFYINKHGCHVILDWKVNGYLSARPPSPMKGYLRLRDITKRDAGSHKEVIPINHKGTIINASHFLESVNKEWGNQLAIYGWLCGCEIGGDFIVAIDQLVCKAQGKYPEIRVAEHRLRVSQDYQWKLFRRIQEVWDMVNSDHIFRDLSKEDSEGKCHLLDMQATALRSPSSKTDELFNQMTRER